MGLSRSVPAIPMKTVEVADGVNFTVRGISPADALGIYFRHSGDLSALYDEFAGKVKKGKPDVVDVRALGENMVAGTPRVLAEIIAVAADGDPAGDEWEADVATALKFSAGVQMDALEKIASLTFTSAMPPKNFLAVVVKLAGSATAALTPSPAA